MRVTVVAKRKVGETWREAVTARLVGGAPDRVAAGLQAFDAALESGLAEAEAAFRVLSAFELLWHVEVPGVASASVATGPDGAERIPDQSP